MQPILKCAGILREHHYDVVVRVYLTADLSFLVDDLVAVGCEVFLMESSSLSHNPGAMWRFLAMEDATCPVIVIDADRAADIVSDVNRMMAAERVGVGAWRVPYDFNSGIKLPMEGYRPNNACQLGSSVRYPMRRLMESFIRKNIDGTFQTSCQLAGLRHTQIIGARWPDYGFDESKGSRRGLEGVSKGSRRGLEGVSKGSVEGGSPD